MYILGDLSLVTYREVELAATHHIVQETVLSQQLRTHRDMTMSKPSHVYLDEVARKSVNTV